MLAGAMVWMTAYNRVFFIPYKYLDDRQTILLRQTGRRAKPGTASVSLADLELHATEVPKHKINMNWDWLKVLVG